MTDRFSSRRRIPKRIAPSADGGVAIGRVVVDVVKALERDKQPPWVSALEQEWPALVGVAVAAHSRPGRLVNGELIVFVDNSTWLSELYRYAQTELLEALQSRFGKHQIRRLRLQLDPGG